MIIPYCIQLGDGSSIDTSFLNQNGTVIPIEVLKLDKKFNEWNVCN